MRLFVPVFSNNIDLPGEKESIIGSMVLFFHSLLFSTHARYN